MARYSAWINGKICGPFSLEQVAKHPQIGLDTRVIPEGLTKKEDWRHARDVPELMALFAPQVPPPLPSSNLVSRPKDGACAPAARPVPPPLPPAPPVRSETHGIENNANDVHHSLRLTKFNPHKPQSILVACVLNLVLPGLGHMYVGQVLVGVFLLLLFLVMGFLLPWISMIVPWAILMLTTVIQVNRHNEKLEAEVREVETKVCPMCAERVQKEARICKHCRHEFGG